MVWIGSASLLSILWEEDGNLKMRESNVMALLASSLAMALDALECNSIDI